jgi:hypothetical protein
MMKSDIKRLWERVSRLQPPPPPQQFSASEFAEWLTKALEWLIEKIGVGFLTGSNGMDYRSSVLEGIRKCAIYEADEFVHHLTEDEKIGLSRFFGQMRIHRQEYETKMDEQNQKSTATP